MCHSPALPRGWQPRRCRAATARWPLHGGHFSPQRPLTGLISTPEHRAGQEPLVPRLWVTSQGQGGTSSAREPPVTPISTHRHPRSACHWRRGKARGVTSFFLLLVLAALPSFSFLDFFFFCTATCSSAKNSSSPSSTTSSSSGDKRDSSRGQTARRTGHRARVRPSRRSTPGRQRQPTGHGAPRPLPETVPPVSGDWSPGEHRHSPAQQLLPRQARGPGLAPGAQPRFGRGDGGHRGAAGSC